MARNRVTLQTIADALGVSRTTVSNAYNRPDQLAPALRDRILATARQLGYAGPDPAARRLRAGGREAVGLMLTEALSYAFTDPAAVMFLEGLARATERAGLALLLLPAMRGAETGTALVRDAVVDAFCLYSMPDGLPEVAAARDRGLPLVVVDEPRTEGTAFVGIDDRTGMRMAAEHLVGLGHRRFAVIADRLAADGYTGPADTGRQQAATFQIARERLGGCRDALLGADVRWEDVPILENAVNAPAAGAASARTLLARDPRPSAVVALTDQLALGALQAAWELGVSVPGDLSVVGFDDVPAAALTHPGLTTVRQPLLEKGLVAGRMIVEGEAAAGREVLLPVELVVRGSTGPSPDAR